MNVSRNNYGSPQQWRQSLIGELNRTAQHASGRWAVQTAIFSANVSGS